MAPELRRGEHDRTSGRAPASITDTGVMVSPHSALELHGPRKPTKSHPPAATGAPGKCWRLRLHRHVCSDGPFRPICSDKERGPGVLVNCRVMVYSRRQREAGVVNDAYGCLSESLSGLHPENQLGRESVAAPFLSVS